MGVPKDLKIRSVGIPAVMVTRDSADAVRAAIGERPDSSRVRIVLGRSPHFRSRLEREAVGQLTAAPAANPTSSPYRPASDFVPTTQPARFIWPGRSQLYAPKVGVRPPKAVQHGHPSAERNAADAQVIPLRVSSAPAVWQA